VLAKDPTQTIDSLEGPRRSMLALLDGTLKQLGQVATQLEKAKNSFVHARR